MTARRPFARLRAAALLVSAALVAPRTQAPVRRSASEPAAITAEELPPVAEIEAAAAQYDRAAEQARTADRGKRAARKVLDRLPAGTYGAWQVERVANARETADLEAIRAIFAANGLGPVPMKPCAPSLKVTRIAAETEAPEASLRVLVAAA